MADQLPPDPSPMPDLLPEAVPETPFWNAAPVLGPPPQIPIPGPVPLPSPSAQDPKQHILTLAALGMMMGMGPHGGVGAAQGLQAAQAHMDAEKLRQFAYQQQVQQHQAAQAQQQQQQANQIYQQRQAGLQRVLLDFNAKLKGVTSQEDYDTLIQNYSGALQAGGYRGATPDWFRHEFQWTTPKAEAVLQKAIDKVTTSEPYKKLTAENPEAWKQFTIQVAVDPKHPDVKTPFTLPQAYAKLGIEFGGADAEGVPAFVPIGKGTEEQNYIIEAKGAFDAQFHRPPKTPADNTWIMDRVAKRKAEAQALKRDPLAEELARQRLGDARDKKANEQAAATDTAQQLVDGDLVPSMLSRRQGYNEILAEASRISRETTGQPYNAVKAQLEFEASKRFITSLNSTQQLRFRSLGGSVVNTIDEVRRLSALMQQSGIQVLNALELNGVLKLQGNSPKGQLVAQYLGAVNTLKEEFANLVNGGMAPTEPAFALANQQINANYGVKAMDASLTEVQRLIKYRLNAPGELKPLFGGAPPEEHAPANYLSADPNAGQRLRR